MEGSGRVNAKLLRCDERLSRFSRPLKMVLGLAISSGKRAYGLTFQSRVMSRHPMLWEAFGIFLGAARMYVC